MRRSAMVMGLALALAASGAARAGAYADAMGKCLVKSSSQADRSTLMVWLFVAMSAGPAVQSMSTATPAQRDDANKQAAALLERLLTQDCRSETVDALRNEGPAAIQQSFMVVGQVAMASLMQDPAVMGQVQGVARYLDIQKFTSLLADTAPEKK